MPEAARFALARPRKVLNRGIAAGRAMRWTQQCTIRETKPRLRCRRGEKTLRIRRERVDLARQTLSHLQQPWQNYSANPPHASVAYRDTTDLERLRCR
jgi:hypothetical protein